MDDDLMTIGEPSARTGVSVKTIRRYTDQGLVCTAGRWLAMTALAWFGAAPFAALGVAIGYVADSDSANIVDSGALLLLAFLGALFVPLETMPAVVQEVGRTLPSDRVADLAWGIASDGRPPIASGIAVAAWTGILGAAA